MGLATSDPERQYICIMVKVNDNEIPCPVVTHRELRAKVTGIPLDAETWFDDMTSEHASYDYKCEMSEQFQRPNNLLTKHICNSSYNDIKTVTVLVLLS